VSKFLKRESCENQRRSGRPRKTDDRGDRKILRCVKTDRRQNLTEITNKVNNVLPNTNSSRTVRKRYDSMGSQGEQFVRPSPFGLRTDITAYIGVDQNLDGL
jgi:hypothetical protein